MASGHRHRRHEGEGEIPVSSFADIAFLLIIYFILVTTLVKTQGFVPQVPAGEKSEESQKTNTVLLHNDEIRFNDDVMSVQQLSTKLRDLRLDRETEENKVVLVEATGRVEYQQYFDVAAAITNAGGAVGITVEEEE